MRGSDSIDFCNNYPLFILSIEEQIAKEIEKVSSSVRLRQKNKIPNAIAFGIGAGNQNRTDDLVITNDVLYRLSHTSIRLAEREGFEPS